MALTGSLAHHNLDGRPISWGIHENKCPKSGTRIDLPESYSLNKGTLPNCDYPQCRATDIPVTDVTDNSTR